MSQATASKQRERTGFASPGTWAIDPSHSSMEFVVRHLKVAKVRGRFGEFSGAIHIDENPRDSWAEATINAASIDTRDPQRDEHLRSSDFFDTANFPTLNFRTTGIELSEGVPSRVRGDLTIRGVTRPVTLDVEFQGLAIDPWGNERAVFSAGTTINREDFGLTWNQPLETGGWLVSKEVRIDLEIEAVRQ
jgi:polyisoprenoid-binding protein YceI